MIDKIDFLIGDERQFSDFIGMLGEEKTVVISHNDLDGAVSALVANYVVKADTTKFIDYIDINEGLVKELKAEKAKKVIFLDLNIDDINIIKEIEKFADVLVIDHHRFADDFSSDKTTFINTQGFCTSYLCYYLFSRIKEMEELDWIVACASLSDWLFVCNANWLKKIYEKYGEKFVLDDEGIKKSEFWNIQYDLSLALLYFRPNVMRVYGQIGKEFGDIGDLKKYADEVNKEVKKAIDRFSKESVIFKGNYFWELSAKFPVKDIVVNILSSKKSDTTFIIAEGRGEYCKVSARRQDGKVNLPVMLKNLTSGFNNSSAGGHIRAAGANFPSKYLEEFKKRLREM